MTYCTQKAIFNILEKSVALILPAALIKVSLITIDHEIKQI